MTHYLLDTNMVSYIVTGRSLAARSRLERVSHNQQLGISAVTAGEIYYGLTRIGASPKRRKAMDLFFATLTVYPWDLTAAEAYGQLRARQEAKGRPLGPYDLQIAAHAIALGAILISHDKAFRHVTSLPGYEDWASDL